MFIVIKSEHYDCTNLICKKDTLEEAVAAVKDSMAQRINKNYHTGLTGADITHENEERYRFSFDFDENRPADNSEPRVHGSYDFWKGDDEESVEWAVFEVTTDKPFFLLSYEEYESIELTGFYDTFDEAFGEMKELIAESVNDVFDEDATADDVEDMENYNVFVHSNKDSQDNGAPLAFASFCDDYPNREWTVFHLPKVGNVKVKVHRQPDADWVLKGATVSCTRSGKYFVSLLYEFEKDIQPIVPTKEKSLGLDYSSHDFYVDSNGKVANYPQFYRQSEEKLAKEQRKLSRMEADSKNYNEQLHKIQLLHEHIANQRKNFCHTVSAAIAKQYDAVFVEDINLRGLAGSLKLGKSTNDNGFGMFRTMLEYKLTSQGKTFAKIDKWYPSLWFHKRRPHAC